MNLPEFLYANPPSLEKARLLFSDPKASVDFAASWRWPDGKVICPTCGSEAVTWMPTRFLWQCKTRHPKRQFSVKVGTVFEDSPIALGKWLFISWMLTNHHEYISTYWIAREIEVTHKAAWFMKKRLRKVFILPEEELLAKIM